MNHAKPRYRVKEAFDLLGLAHSVGYLRIAAGELRATKDGRRSFITAEELDRYVAGRPRAASAPDLVIVKTDVG